MTDATEVLSTTDYAVLASLAEGEAHGFRVAASFSDGGALVDIWTLQRTQVYRALERLEGLSLIHAVRQEAGAGAPSRTVYRLTPAGEAAHAAWLLTPVTQVRYGRSDLRLKLAFLLRAEHDPTPLLLRQREVFSAFLMGLEANLPTAAGVGRMSLLWRLEMARGSLRFVETLLADVAD